MSVHEIVRMPTPSTLNLQLRASPGAQSITMGSWRGSICNLGSLVLGAALWAAWGTHITWRLWLACLLPGP